MNISQCNIKDALILTPTVIQDNRGLFMETYNRQRLDAIGLKDEFVQDNISTSVKGVLRGMHVQKDFPQAKIVNCLKGEIYDVIVDCRTKSDTFGLWHGELLTSINKKQIYVPKGVAHGFLTLSDCAEIFFKVTTHYHVGDEIGFLWNDSKVGINWPINNKMELILADKDIKWSSFEEMISVIKHA